jgi:hypothetical protein
MLFQIKCDCGHVGLVSGLPRMAHCSACDTVRLFRVCDGYPIIAKLATVDEETREEERERKLADERMEWAAAYQNNVQPWLADDVDEKSDASA